MLTVQGPNIREGKITGNETRGLKHGIDISQKRDKRNFLKPLILTTLRLMMHVSVPPVRLCGDRVRDKLTAMTMSLLVAF